MGFTLLNGLFAYYTTSCFVVTLVSLVSLILYLYKREKEGYHKKISHFSKLIVVTTMNSILISSSFNIVVAFLVMFDAPARIQLFLRLIVVFWYIYKSLSIASYLFRFGLFHCPNFEYISMNCLWISISLICGIFCVWTNKYSSFFKSVKIPLIERKTSEEGEQLFRIKDPLLLFYCFLFSLDGLVNTVWVLYHSIGISKLYNSIFLFWKNQKRNRKQQSVKLKEKFLKTKRTTSII